MEMYTMYDGLTLSYEDLWAKRRVDGVEAKATDRDLRDASFGDCLQEMAETLIHVDNHPGWLRHLL